MSNSDGLKSLNDLFKEVYTSKMANMLPNGLKLATMWDYWSMPLDKLAIHAQYHFDASRAHKARSSKLGKYLEGHD